MAVTLTVDQLRAALRLADSVEETAEATRLLAYVTEAINHHANDTSPDVVSNEGARRLAGYLYDMPESARGAGYSNVMRNSGASRILLPYRNHGVGLAS